MDLRQIAGLPLQRIPLLAGMQDAATFVREVVRKLNRRLRSLRLREYPDNDGQGTICELILLGYFRRRPILARTRFFHRRNIVELQPQIQVLPLSDEPVWEFLSGSQLIWDLLCDPNDHRLQDYRSPLFARARNREMLSLLEVGELCRRYIQACADQRASALDPFCAFVGGHVHMAEITELNEFRWLIPPAGTTISEAPFFSEDTH